MAMKLDELTKAVAGGAAAIRAVVRLEPAGGPGDKVFPPTYMKEGRAETKYAMERRMVEGREILTVLLDSVASQANRMEEALLEGWRRRELSFPVVWVEFSSEDGLQSATTSRTPSDGVRFTGPCAATARICNCRSFRAT